VSRQKRPVEPKAIPPDSPNGKAIALNLLAKTIPLQLDGLPQNERRYVQQVHKLLIKYWHRQLSREEFQAWQRWLACNQLYLIPKRQKEVVKHDTRAA